MGMTKWIVIGFGIVVVSQIALRGCSSSSVSVTAEPAVEWSGKTLRVSGGTNRSVGLVDGGAVAHVDGFTVHVDEQNVRFGESAVALDNARAIDVALSRSGLKVTADGRELIKPSAGQRLEMMKARAAGGDVKTQLDLARMYQQGGTLAKDPVEAAKWLLMAAEAGDASAQLQIASRYRTGSQGVEKNLPEAVNWYRKAAESGNATGQHSLGRLYERGEGVGQDLKEAARLYQQAAKQGSQWAQVSLAALYATGRGVEKNPEEAVDLLYEATKKPHPEAKYWLGRVIEEYEEQLSKRKIWPDPRPATRTAAYWYREAVKQNNAKAMVRLGELHLAGKGVPKNAEQAADFFRRAAERHEPAGQAAWAAALLDGIGTTRNREEAISWYKKAALRGHEGAKAALAELDP